MRQSAGVLTGMVMGLLLAAAPVLAAAVQVDAKTVVAAPDWVAGSTWYYSDGYALKVSSAAAGATVFDRLDAPGQWFSRQGFLRKDLTSGTATRTSIFRTIPDQAGRSLRADSPLTFQREYLENGSLMVHASSWSVEGRETITVPAGTFDCWIIVWRSRSLQSDWTSFERWWYSPQAQNYVRMEYKYGPDSDGSRVLMRYNIGAQVAEIPAQSAIDVPVVTASAKSAAVEIAPVTQTNTDTSTAITEAAAVDTAAEPAPEIASVAPTPAIAAAAPVAASAVNRAAPRKSRDVKHPAAKPIAAPARAKAIAVPASFTPAMPGRTVWHAQIASSKEEAAVRKSLDKLLHRHAEALGGIPSGISSAQIDNRGLFYRAWLGQFERSAAAVALCGTLTARGAACSVSKSRRSDERTG